MNADQPRWFHITAHTYGAWLYGDPRRFRTRHHREHVEGDYKNPPPPGTYDAEFARSKELLKQPPVRLAPEWRWVVGEAVLARFLGLGARVIAVGMSSTHLHALARMPPDAPREWTGLAKKHAWFVARGRGWSGLLWAKRSHAEPIRDRGHQENTFHYIARHREQGAWVWTFREPLPVTPATGAPIESSPAQSPPAQSPPVATGGLADTLPEPPDDTR